MKDFRNLPLPTLRTFEAAARHQSLSKAAAELHLTDSAVSHQLRKLESTLGYDLFNKAGRGVVLTEAGQVFAKTVAAALQNILASALLLSEVGQEGGRLDIACPPMFAGGWLAKHLKGFCRDHPSVECHIRLSENQKIHEIADVDVGILFGTGGWPHKWSTLLAHVNITPVCSPMLFNQLGRTITKVSDLHDVILLHWDDGSEWRRWLTEAGVQDPHSFTRGLYCSDLGMAIDLAINGTGVALVSDTLSSSDLATGNLLAPFAFSIDAFGGWHAVCSQASLQRSSTRLFMRWLLGHFGGSAALDAALAHPGMINP